MRKRSLDAPSSLIDSNEGASPGPSDLIDALPDPVSVLGGTIKGASGTRVEVDLFRFLKDRTFPLLREMGWTYLLPVIPPRTPTGRAVELSPYSKVPAQNIGKIPGRRNGEGKWAGFPGWQNYVATAADCRLWQQWDASIGYRCEDVMALDCDVMDERLSVAIWTALKDSHGLLREHMRIGQPPKWLIPLRVEAPITPWNAHFRNPKTGELGHFQMLGHGQQFVLWGLYPKLIPNKQDRRNGNGKFGLDKSELVQAIYQWRRPPPRFDALHWATPADITGIRRVVEEVVITEGWEVVDAQLRTPRELRTAPDQQSLAGPQKWVTSAIEGLPNDGIVVPDHAAKIKLCCAIKAASIHWEEEGRQLWHRWAAKFMDGRGYDADWCEERWRSFKPPYLVGAQYILDLASKYTGFNTAAVKFEDVLVEYVQPAKSFKHVIDPNVLIDVFDIGVDRETARYPKRGVEYPSEQGHEPGSSAPEGGSVDDLIYDDQEYTDDPLAVAAAFSSYSDEALAAKLQGSLKNRIAHHGEHGWMSWSGTIWRTDHSSVAAQASRYVRRALVREGHTVASRITNEGISDKERRELESLRKALGSQNLNDRLVKSLAERLNRNHAEFDPDAHLLNCPNGVVDLRTGELADPHCRTAEQMFTRVTGVDINPSKGSQSPGYPARWLQFLDEVTEGDSGLVAWLQRAVGYSLWGALPEAVVFYVWGPGGNGKSVFLNVLQRVLGSYATTVGGEVFTMQGANAHPEAIARLEGTRFLSATEIPARATWNETRLKAFSSGDPYTARDMYKSTKVFSPVGALWFAGNDQPKLAAVDEAIRRRLRMVHFRFQPLPEQIDDRLTERLLAEGPAILAWAVEGCIQWQAQGLGWCDSVREATGAYLDAEDALGAWIAQSVVVAPGSDVLVPFMALRKSWETHCRTAAFAGAQASESVTDRSLALRIGSIHGVKRIRAKRKGEQTGYTGLTLRD